jgi:hypothetical protein
VSTSPWRAALRLPRLTYANVAATAALALAAGGGALAIADGTTVINACVKNPDTTSPGKIRIVDAGVACTATETALNWNQEGPPGPAGSPDTPQQVLDKIVQVDGDGSGLDASFLDGINSTGFLRSNGKAVDADKLDGINSTGFLKRAALSNGTIGLSAIAANTCKDVVFGIGAIKVGDVGILNVAPGDALPARLTMNALDVPADGQLNVRICNGTNTASVADSDIKVRWAFIRP